MSLRILSPGAMVDTELDEVGGGRGEGVLEVVGVDVELPPTLHRDIDSFPGIQAQILGPSE